MAEENGLTPLEEERRKALFGEDSEIDETLLSSSAEAETPPSEETETEEPLESIPDETTVTEEPTESESAGDLEPSLEETMGGSNETPSEIPPWEMSESDEEEAYEEAMPDKSELDDFFPDLSAAPLEEDEPPPLPEPDVTIFAEATTPEEPEPEAPVEAVEEVPAVEVVEEEPVVDEAEAEPAVEVVEEQPVIELPELEAVVEPVPEAVVAPAEPEKAKVPAWIEEAEAEAAAKAAEAQPAEPTTMEDLKAAPVIDWSTASPAEVAEATTEGLEKLAAPFTALPAADAPIDVPSPVLKSEEAKPFPLVEAAETADEQLVLERITQARHQKLMTRIDNLLDHVYDRYSQDTDHSVLEEALKLLKTARHTMIENPRDYDTAEYYTHRAKLIIDNFQNVRKDSYGWPGWTLVIYEALFMVIVGLLWVFGDEIIDFFVSRGAAEWTLAPWYTMLAGASGGVFGAFWALYKHIAEYKDFSRQYTMWYIGSPITGALAGISIFFLSQVGILGMSVGSSGSISTEITNPNWFLAIIAVLAGFKQNVILDLFARLVKLIDASDK